MHYINCNIIADVKFVQVVENESLFYSCLFKIIFNYVRFIWFYSSHEIFIFISPDLTCSRSSRAYPAKSVDVKTFSKTTITIETQIIS